jgi:DNA repair protein RecO (recombination protein O)
LSKWIIVGSTNLGESDRLVRFLCPEEGRVALVARGARASRKRFAGQLELGNRVTVLRRKGRGSLDRLDGVDEVRAPSRARTDLDRIALLAWGCELCSGLAGEGQASPKLHRLLEVWLDLLDAEAIPGVPSRLALEAKALTFAGLSPALIRCARTGAPLVGKARWDAEIGGAHSGAVGRPISGSDLSILEALRRTPLSETPGCEPPSPNAHWILADFAEYQLGRQLRSRRLLSELTSHGPAMAIRSTEEAE